MYVLKRPRLPREKIWAVGSNICFTVSMFILLIILKPLLHEIDALMQWNTVSSEVQSHAKGLLLIFVPKKDTPMWKTLNSHPQTVNLNIVLVYNALYASLSFSKLIQYKFAQASFLILMDIF